MLPSFVIASLSGQTWPLVLLLSTFHLLLSTKGICPSSFRKVPVKLSGGFPKVFEKIPETLVPLTFSFLLLLRLFNLDA